MLPALIVLGLAYAGIRLLGGSPAPSEPAARAIVWDGHAFATRNDLARWLGAHGAHYRVWARRHPALADGSVRQSEAALASPSGHEIGRCSLPRRLCSLPPGSHSCSRSGVTGELELAGPWGSGSSTRPVLSQLRILPGRRRALVVRPDI